MKPPCPGRRRRLAGRSGLLLLLALAAGCRGGQGTVSGRVLYNGKPVTGGWVTFRPADGRKNTVNALLDANGNYEAVLPAGEVLIAVDNRELERQAADRGAARPALPPGLKLPAGAKPGAEPPAAKTAPDRPPGTYVPIPEQYYDVDTSGLKYTVKSGPQSHDIELR